MQKRSGLFILFFITSFVIFSSCSKKTNKEGRYVPKTASVVFLINGESMSSKLPWEEIKQSELFKEVYSDTSLQAYMKTVLENPENTGIDTKKNMLFYVQKDSIGGYVAFEGTIKDAAKFKDFNNKVNKDASESEKDGIHFITSKRITSSWDKEKFVIVIDAPEMDTKSRYRDTNDSSTPASARNTVATATSIYSLLEDNSLAKDEKFTELVNKKGDIHFWMNIASLSSADNMRNFSASMLNLNKFTDGSYLTGVTNFDNGKINVDIKTYSGKELSDIYKKYSGSKLNTDMIKRVPAKDVAALFAFSFKPDGLKELIKLTNLEGFINIGLAQLGVSIDDFIKANKGDVLLSVSDISKDSNGMPKVNAIFAASIADKAAFGKLIEAGTKLSKERFGGATDKYVSYSVNDNFFAIGTDKPSVDKFISTANNSNYSFLDKASGSSSILYLNLPLLMTSLGDEMARDSLDNLLFKTTTTTWESVIATGGGFENGGSNIHIEINLADKNTNSLKQLNKYISTIGEIQQQKKKKRDEWLNAMPTPDSTEATVAPVEDTH